MTDYVDLKNVSSTTEENKNISQNLKNSKPKEVKNSDFELNLQKNCNIPQYAILHFPLPEDFEIPQPEFLVDGLILKNSINFFCGDGGVGKSTLLNYITISILSQRDVFGRQTHLDDAPKRALLINCEECQEVITRLGTLSKEMEIKEEFEIINQSSIDRKIIKELFSNPSKRPSFVVIEPFRCLAEELNTQKDVNKALAPWIEIAQKYNTTIICIHHHNKKGDYSGSHVIRDTARLLWNVDRTDDGYITLTCEKANCQQPTGLKLKREEDGYMFEYVDDISQQQDKPQKNITKKQLKKQQKEQENQEIKRLYEKENMSATDISKKLNINYNHVNYIINNK
ncbi:MAG: AAA family ATPase [Bacteroidales bacterium]|jgi:RecA-family ATPase|nr:AAA family ATPase [Bacteroidales bacterium]MCH3923443.1 AAA family ATPase [Bacteroidales bacterium]